MNDQLRYKIRGWAYWSKCANPFSSTITINELPLGLRLRAYKRDAVGRGLFRRGIHEPGLTNLLLTRFAGPAERRFIDAGANIGYFSCLMSKLAGPAGQVLAIEPEPKNIALLRQNLRINNLTNVMVHACALGASEGSAMLGLYKPSNRGRHSIVASGQKQAIEVPITTLDNLTRASGNDLKSWSLVKIDVEGYEAFVLDGARETLSRTRTLVMEFSPAILKMAGVDPAAIFDRLSGHFQHMYRIENTDLVKVTAGQCLSGDNQLDLVFER